MAKTKIDWCDEVWNPVWGCLHGCSFCYAKKFAQRFSKRVAQWNGVNEKDLREFKPTFLPKNFEKKLTGRIIFVNSMSDIADWEEEWVEKVFRKIIEDNKNDRVFLFLSKRPVEGYLKVYETVPLCELPKEKIWFGISASTTEEFIQRSAELMSVFENEDESWKFEKGVIGGYFVSFEPLKEKIIRDKGCLGFYDWIIIGAQTNPLKLPQKEWVESLTRRAKNLNIPVFHKENLASLDIELLKEFPF